MMATYQGDNNNYQQQNNACGLENTPEPGSPELASNKLRNDLKEEDPSISQLECLPILCDCASTSPEVFIQGACSRETEALEIRENCVRGRKKTGSPALQHIQQSVEGWSILLCYGLRYVTRTRKYVDKRIVKELHGVSIRKRMVKD